MSIIRKTKKIIFHPVLFFQDRERKILARQRSNKLVIRHQMSVKIEVHGHVAGIDLKHYEVALYFFGSVGNIYQIEQWIPTLNVLRVSENLLLIVRLESVYKWLVENTDFTVVLCKTIDDLTYVYETNNIKCVLYVNQGVKNFQSLILGDALHVHINHGESDKISTITNQSKAYDYVFIVSDAGYDKYNLNLIKKDMGKFISIGRPQLDHIEKIEPFNKPFSIEVDGEEIIKKIILFAPTWEGTHESMNFSSITEYGMTLIQQVINNDEYYLIYKPHPNTGSRDQSYKKTNDAIIKFLDGHSNGESILGGDINSLYEHVDLAIFDNSAVAVDYLQVNKPMIMSDMFHRVRGRKAKPTIIKAARMISNRESSNISNIIKEELLIDTKEQDRQYIRKYFLGDFDYSKNESTERFISEVQKIIKERDLLVLELDKVKVNI